MKIFDDYDSFAWAYSKYWGAESGERWLPVVERLVLCRVPQGAEILDLCCGSGELARLLTRSGYNVTGLDGSGELLSVARERSPETEFIHADVRDFRLPRKFHAALCIFDSLNHVMTLDELIATFRNVHAGLLGGGLFLFDLNTEHKYLTTWPGSFAIVEDDHVIAVRADRLPEERIATFDAAIFRARNGEWNRSDAALRQTWYQVDEVVSALEDAGFTSIQMEHAAEGKQEKARIIFHCIA